MKNTIDNLNHLTDRITLETTTFNILSVTILSNISKFQKLCLSNLFIDLLKPS